MIFNPDFKIAGLVVAYRNKEKLVRCINALLNQSYPLYCVIVVDNSEMKLYPDSQYDDDRVVIINAVDNMGISGGLNIGFQYALTKGLDWCWTFDQDSEPLSNALEELLKYLPELIGKYSNKIGIISSTGISTVSKMLYRGNSAKWLPSPTKISYHNLIYECDLLLTAGSLTNLNFIKLYGGMNEILFIDWVDYELCLRMVKKKYKLLCCQSSLFYHQIGGEVEYSNNQIETHKFNKIRLYYLIRNGTYCIIHQSFGFKRFFYLFFFMLKEFYYIKKQDEQMTVFFVALYHGLLKIMKKHTNVCNLIETHKKRFNIIR